MLSLMGPRAREILSQVTTDDVSNEAFPFGQTRRLRCGAFDVQALRVTYVGELGWELHVAVEHAGELFDRLHAAGAAHGLVNAGYRAIETLRLEKGYRAWPGEVGPDHTPLEAGLADRQAQEPTSIFGALCAGRAARVRADQECAA